MLCVCYLFVCAVSLLLSVCVCYASVCWCAVPLCVAHFLPLYLCVVYSMYVPIDIPLLCMFYLLCMYLLIDVAFLFLCVCLCSVCVCMFLCVLAYCASLSLCLFVCVCMSLCVLCLSCASVLCVVVCTMYVCVYTLCVLCASAVLSCLARWLCPWWVAHGCRRHERLRHC